jgi:outer membrane lipase/esterase
MNRVRAALAALCLIVAAPLASAASLVSPYSQLVFFGDSLSDNGNVYALSGGLFPPAPYVDGRFSNGPVAAEYMAGALGLPLTDFAFGGAKTGTDINGNDNYRWDLGLNGTGMQAQVGLFAAGLGGASADASALYGVWGGPNDYFEAGLTPPESVANLMGIINDLYTLGARNFFIPNMPDLGLTAQFFGTAEQAFMTFVSQSFNALLDGGVMSLGLSLPDASFITFDTFNFVHEVFADPASFGFANLTEACLGSFACALDPGVQDGYLYWDGVHPTTAAHARLGLAFAEAVAVPEPGGLWLLALALLLPATGTRLRSR